LQTFKAPFTKGGQNNRKKETVWNVEIKIYLNTAHPWFLNAKDYYDCGYNTI
jgi:hypothetical protein